ncbi:c-type cytochrome [Oryzomicrobium sp.]|uniref:c-type cytochrome n=1 Tax=Oryzomicrobium sp. TaxID=1911578 RepID=UPI002FDFD1A3
MKLLSRIACAAVCLACTAGAHAQMKTEDAIKFRQSAYGFLAWNMGKIKANLDGNFNKEQVANAARAIAAVANSGMGALYVPGSDKGAGWKETRLKSEFFAQQEEAGKLARAFGAAANELEKVAATGDVAAIKAQFGKTGETCKGCHDKFRKD